MLLILASLFFTDPSPLEMPRASAYLVKEKGVLRLEDRYDRLDLWISRAVDGCWRDGQGREFMLATLDVAPPALAADSALTREEYSLAAVPVDLKRKDSVFAALDKLSPVVPAEEFTRPRQLSRGYKDVRYYQGTNENAIVCAYLPEKAAYWSYASWTLAEGDDFDGMLKLFEREFLDRREWKAERSSFAGLGEREQLRRDARHSVAAYANWRVTDSDEFTVLDNLNVDRHFIAVLTNDLKVMRAKYAAALPSPIDGSNVLAVARIFSSRAEYLKALEVNAHQDMEWSAAYWSPSRRELVAYLPKDGVASLLKTVRHEAFHQYLSYATSMIPSSPWLNEGYAQYFENADGEIFEFPAGIAVEEAARLLPALLAMDYAEFYAGTGEERELKYRLAESIAHFIEHGARKVRFDPFGNLKRDYIRSLLETKDMRKATLAAFGNTDNMLLFVAEWKKYWEKR